MLSPAFTSVLQSGRTEFNRRFLEAKHKFPELNPDAFARFLEMCVDPLVQAVAAADSWQAHRTASDAYDAALELVGQKLAGSGSSANSIEEGWRSVLLPAAPRVAEAPCRAISAVCNALHHLETTPGARPAQWISTMSKLAPSCGSLQALLTAGQVTAWRAGMAHYRQSALAAADSLPPDLALLAVGGAAADNWQQIRARLESDPWFDPSNPVTGNTLRVGTRAGAFRGFGGLLPQPPTVTAQGDRFLVRSGEEAWLLTADAFGATFHRTAATEFEAASGGALPADIQLRGDSVTRGKNSLKLPVPGNITSAAANGTTLAVTSRLTHAVLLIALT